MLAVINANYYHLPKKKNIEELLSTLEVSKKMVVWSQKSRRRIIIEITIYKDVV